MVFFRNFEGIFEIARQRAVGNAEVRTNLFEKIPNPFGIFLLEYILTSEEKHLNLRQFDDKTKRKVFEKQKGKCVWCKKTFEFEGMEADHITPWHEGGKTTAINCQLLCKDDNRKKSGK